MSTDTSASNAFTRGPIVRTLLKTALPIILVMSMNGLLTVVDAMFLGIFVGPDALSAVTLMFPAYMVLAALATLVASGMSSLLARHLGAGETGQAQAVFASAHGLAWTFSAALICLFLTAGYDAILAAAEGSRPIAAMAHTYLAITIWCSPLLFTLSVNSDALRNEGQVLLMAGLSLFVSLANIAFNYVLIAGLEMGVAGTAYGTALAQLLAFAIVLFYRLWGRTSLHPSVLLQYPLHRGWSAILALGAPQSLSFIGIALGSAATFVALQWYGSEDYSDTVAAFGIMTRIMTFVYLPLLGLSQALQTTVGNNYGARLLQRSDATLRMGLITAFAYCLCAEVLLSASASTVGAFFVDDPAVIAEVERILPVMVAMFFAAGPLFMIATYFQALGDAKRAALLSLIKPYFFFLPLVWGLPVYVGERGIWLAGPVAEGLLLALTFAVLASGARRGTGRWGLFLEARPSREY